MSTETSTGSAEREEPGVAGLSREQPARLVHPLVVVAISLVLGAVMMLSGGYQLGVGNQAIQIAFLRHAGDPSLYANDVMVRETYPYYASYFFSLLSPLLRVTDVATLYFWLHVVTSWGLLSAVAFLARAMFRSDLAALLAMAMIVAGHHTALAGDPIYSSGFTHTYFVLPVAVAAMVLLFRGGVWGLVGAFAVAGMLFNLHALTAAYLFVLMLAATLVDLRPRGWKTIGLAAAVFVLCAVPTLLHMAMHRQVYDATWMGLMRVRSADHSFPLTWWAAGNPDVPRYALVLALTAVAWSAIPATRSRRMIRMMVIAAMGLFAAGVVFTEVWPSATVIRLQPLRASRLLLVVLLLVIACGAARAMVGAIRRDGAGAAARGVRVLEALAAVVTVAVLAIPALLHWLPWAVLLGAIGALAAGRLSWRSAAVVAGALVTAVLAYRSIQFPIPLLSAGGAGLHVAMPGGMVLGLLVAAAVVALLMLVKARVVRVAAAAAAMMVGGAALPMLWSRLGPAHTEAELQARLGQQLKQHTAKDAVILAPTGSSSLRIFAERSLVTDWRDGTQLYFAAKFAEPWIERVTAIEPGLQMSTDRSRLLSRGTSLATLEDAAIVERARQFGATHVLLPNGKERRLREIAKLETSTLYAAEMQPPSTLAASQPAGVIDAKEWAAAESFLRETVPANIEKHRTSAVTVQVVDAAGRPVYDLPFSLVQTGHAFHFGASLGFFDKVRFPSYGDQKPPPVTWTEREKFLEVFNASMIPFSSKWMYIEPTPNLRTYSDLEKYIDFCSANGIAVEFHHLAGHQPQWLKLRSPVEQAARYHEHARSLVERYGDRVAYWQVSNDELLLRAAPPLFAELRQKAPGAKLGLSDCTRFFSPNKSATREREICNGIEGLRRMKAMGVQVDYFAIHGHYPVGLWADPREMYEVLDAFEREGVKVHISEMLLPLGTDIAGPLRRGKWTPELAAEYYEQFYRVAFSHPAVEMVNLWGIGPDKWGSGAGLLDEEFQPRPAFVAIKKLLHETWKTRLEGTLGLDGQVRARAYHGTYELRVGDAKVTFPISEGTSSVRVQLDRATGEMVVK